MNLRRRPAAARGSRRAIALAAIEMPFGVFLGSMAMVAFFYRQQLPATGTGGCCEAADQSDLVAMALVFSRPDSPSVWLLVMMRRVRRSITEDASFARDRNLRRSASRCTRIMR